MKTLRLVLALVAALASAAFLAPPPPPMQRMPGRTPVVFWHMWSGEWQPVVETICRRFNESQSEYEVIPLSIPPAGAESKFLCGASGGDVPDLVSQWNPVLGMWTERGLIQPIENVMTPEEKAQFLREAFPIIRKHAVYDGKVMAIIGGVDVGAVFYRLDHLAEIGLDARHLPKSLEELAEVGRKLDRYDANGRLRRVGFLPQSLMDLVPSFGGGFGTGKQMAFDTPENLRALEFIVGNLRRVGFDKVTRFAASQAADAGVNAPMISGNYSILIDGQWRVKQIAQFAPHLPYVVAPIPPPRGGLPSASMSGPNYMVIPAKAKHAKGAWAFLKYWIGFTDPEAGAQGIVEMGWLPYSRKVAEAPSYQKYLRDNPQYKTFVDLMASPNLATPPISPMQSFVMNEIQKANDVAVRGTQTPREALAGLEAAVRTESERQRRLGNVR